MNPTVAEKGIYGKPAPAWRKRALFAALLTSVAAGAAFSMPVLRQSAAGFSTPFKKTVSARPGETITCQGMSVGKNGVALAFIDGQTVESGAAVSGVEILEITATSVLVGYKGETCRLAPGESFTPGKK